MSRSAKNMVLPLLHPVRGKDGREMSEITIPQNTLLLLNFQGSNYNTELWGDDAHEWKPERWLQPAPPALEEARMPGVYSNMSVASRFCVAVVVLCLPRLPRVVCSMSFSGGTRSCIGFKFSQLEMSK